jgi:hypothetical protein
MKTLARIFINWLLGISNAQWKTAIATVLHAESKGGNFLQKIETFNTVIRPHTGSLQDYAINTLRENAHAYAKKTKLIP